MQAHQDRISASVGVNPYPIFFRKGQKITKSRPRMTCRNALSHCLTASALPCMHVQMCDNVIAVTGDCCTSQGTPPTCWSLTGCPTTDGKGGDARASP